MLPFFDLLAKRCFRTDWPRLSRNPLSSTYRPPAAKRCFRSRPFDASSHKGCHLNHRLAGFAKRTKAKAGRVSDGGGTGTRRAAIAEAEARRAAVARLDREVVKRSCARERLGQERAPMAEHSDSQRCTGEMPDRPRKRYWRRSRKRGAKRSGLSDSGWRWTLACVSLLSARARTV
jgi:hypothetical protein